MKKLILAHHRPVRRYRISRTPEKQLTSINTGLALQGYDPVGYFTDSKPVKGDPKFTATYKGGTYHFASAAHRTPSRATRPSMRRSSVGSVVMRLRSTSWRRSRWNISRSCTVA